MRPRRFPPTSWRLGVLGLLFWGAGLVHAEDRYFFILFSAQGEPNLPRTSHAFATFVKASGSGQELQDYALDAHTISWLPARGGVDVMRIFPQPGKNYDLRETLAWSQSVGARVNARGPFEVSRDLYEMAKAQIDRLNQGQIQYVVLDRRFRGRGASNCMHAVCDLDTKQPTLYTGTAYAHAGSDLIQGHLQRYLVNADTTHSWLIDRLNLRENNVAWLSPGANRTPTVAASAPAAATVIPVLAGEVLLRPGMLRLAR